METLPLTGATAKQDEGWVSYEAYLNLPHDRGLIEWVDGVVIYHQPLTENHQNLVAHLMVLLRAYADFYDLGNVYHAPFEMKCLREGPSREPDILFVATANLERLKNGYRVAGPADLVVEVVCEDSVARDYDEKFIEYEEGGVEEYWILDPRPQRKRATFFQRGKDGRFQEVPRQAGIYYSKVLINFWLKVDWLWEMPDLMLTFAEIIGLPAEAIAELKMKRQQGPKRF
jgi:Uma2 family endonuclease